MNQEQVGVQSIPQPPPGDLPFVGRAQLLEQLQRFWSAMPSSGARLAVLSGPAGIGKTRLAREFELRTIGSAGPCLFARCYEGEGTPPFWPWATLMRAALRRVSEAEAQRAVRVGGGVSSAILPEVRRYLDPSEPGFELVADRVDASLDAGNEFRLF